MTLRAESTELLPVPHVLTQSPRSIQMISSCLPKRQLLHPFCFLLCSRCASLYPMLGISSNEVLFFEYSILISCCMCSLSGVCTQKPQIKISNPPDAQVALKLGARWHKYSNILIKNDCGEQIESDAKTKERNGFKRV